MPRFSIVIPTRQRADTLAFTIETALAQTHPDFEVVIQNNGDDPATRDVVASFASPRIKLTCSAEILPMAENWEAALTASSGDYIAFIGDDDGIMPDACAICDAVMQDRPALGALQWTPHYYDWPTSLRAAARNRLVVNLPGPAEGAICQSRDLLLQLYDGTLTWTSMPLIYNGAFVRRSVIEKVRAFCGGRYFAGQIPDVHSGIANLWAMRQFLHIDRPLSICGASGHSNGNAHFVGGGGARLQQRFHAENPALHQTIAEYFLDTTNMELTIATALVIGKRVFFNDDPAISINMRNVLLRMGLSANRDPALYDHTIREMRQMGEKFGIDTGSFNLPPKRQAPDMPFQGPVIDSSGRTTCLAVNGAMAGIATIADAVRLAASMLPSRTAAQLNASLPWPESESPVPPGVAADLAELAPHLGIRPNEETAERYFRLTEEAVCAQRADIRAHARFLPGQTTALSVCQIVATPGGQPMAVFIPDILTPLPDAAVRAMPFLARFDLAVCEWPGHGASGETASVALPALAAELAALVDHIVPAGQSLFVIGESVGGLLALALGRLRPRHVRNVILIDTPFHLTRPVLAADIANTWRRSSMSSYLRRLLRGVIGFDPEDPQPVSTIKHHALLKEAPFNCALIPGGIGAQHATPSVVLDEDLATLTAINPSLLRTARITRAGHHVLRDDPQGMLEELNKLLVRA
jgi:glycosyltransferase involved in cell wall biosynthesis/pimeloyl-ACP methyl ester carboxylesterase